MLGICLLLQVCIKEKIFGLPATTNWAESLMTASWRETHLLGFELHSDIAAVGQDIKHWTITVNWMRYRWQRTIPFMCRPQLAKGNEKLKSSTSKGNFLPLKQLLSKFFLEWMKSVQDAFAVCAHCCQPPAWDRAKRSRTIISNYYIYVDT